MCVCVCVCVFVTTSRQKCHIIARCLFRNKLTRL